LAACGALDMSGNLHEWCLNDHEKLEIVNGYGNGESKVLRGGSFYDGQFSATASFRYFNLPYHASRYIGFRLVLSVHNLPTP
jgi:formylglycine-generating enzyme required for sulfatase activity